MVWAFESGCLFAEWVGWLGVESIHAEYKYTSIILPSFVVASS